MHRSNPRRFHRAALPLAVLFCGCLCCAAAGHAADLHYSVSWIGNSFAGKTAWVQQDIEGLWVEPDGTVFTNVYWDEAGGNVQQYRDGQLIAMAGHTHGWGYEGGEAVAANSKYLFIVQNIDNEGGGLKGHSWPPKGLAWSGVSRRQRSDIRRAAPFPGGHGKEGDVLQGAFLPVAEFAEHGRGRVRGLWATETELLVSSPLDGAVKVYDTQSMRPLRSWDVERPDRLCLDRRGRVWVLQRPRAEGTWQALHFTPAGQRLPQKIEFPAGVAPTAMAVDPGNRLLVADAGTDQQIRIYDAIDTAPEFKGTLGTKGGIFAGPIPGRFGDLRLNRPAAVGVDGRGNVYVASSGATAGGSTVLECYSPAGQCRWRRLGLEFVDLADVDPASERDVFTKEEHFAMDWSRSAGREWSYQGYTVNPRKYPDDPRLHLPATHVWVRRLAGRPFLFVSDMTGEFLHVYRFSPQTDGETAIPCALLAKSHIPGKDGYPAHQPEQGQWLWRDRNANGAMDAGEYQSSGKDARGIPVPDERGNIWYVDGDQVCCLPLQGVDERGVPIWDLATVRLAPRPAELDEVRRLQYLPAADAMLLGGNRGDNRNQHWKPMGPVLACYDHWSAATRRLRWRVVLPYAKGSQGHESAEPISFDAAGDYIFVAYTRGLKADGVKYAYVKVFTLAQGAPVGNLIAEKELGEIGLLDIVESVRAVRRANGEYVVFLEDDAKAKIVMFRWQP
ncbi:MAG: hypothetical protein ABSG86_27575 [Thermoguttaceae bacterium]